MGLGAPILQVSIDAATTSEAFEIQGELGFIIVGLVDTGTPTLTLQVSENGSDWTDTEITATGSSSTRQLITSDTVSAVAGLCGHGPLFRWSSSGTVTVTIYHYSRNV